jgi:hypothetical protein
MGALRQRNAETGSRLRSMYFAEGGYGTFARAKEKCGKVFATSSLTRNSRRVQDLDFRTIAVRHHNPIIAECGVVHAKE